MLTYRGVLSCVLAWHLIALSIAALPSAEALSPPVPSEHSDRPIARTLTPLFSATAHAVRRTSAIIASATAPIRPVADRYLGSLAIAPHWRMFSGPPRVHEYVRVNYYVSRDPESTGAASDWMASELITPAHQEDQIRLFQSYRDSSLDKAAMIALNQFERHRRRLPEGREVTGADLPDDLKQLTRFFAERFARRRLLARERIVRAELWYGTAPITGPGESGEELLRERRQEILDLYYDGPREFFGRVTSYPRFHSIQREGDITWVLKFFDQ